MGFILKGVVGLFLLVVVGGFAINSIPSLRDKVLELVNPAVKESGLISQIEKNLNELDLKLAQNSTGNAGSNNNDISASRILIANTKSLLADVQDLNKKDADSSLVSLALNKVAGLLIDKTPYPAEDLTTSAIPLVCPTVIPRP